VTLDRQWSMRPHRHGAHGDYRRVGDVVASIDWLSPHRWGATVATMLPGRWEPDPEMPVIAAGVFRSPGPARAAATAALAKIPLPASPRIAPTPGVRGDPMSVAPDGTAVRGRCDLTGLHPIFLAPDLVLWVNDLSMEAVNPVATDIVTRSVDVPTETIRGTVVFASPTGRLTGTWANFVRTYPGVREVPP
jgi:hypothetical protein